MSSIGLLVLLVGCLPDLPAFDPDADRDGFSLRDGDCDDLASDVHPAADEVCDGVDNDCDGGVDLDAADATTWFPDEDGDGHGDPARGELGCDGDSAAGDDCDDADPDRHPGAAERCDGLDQDCDGAVDEDLALVSWFPDLDGDGWGDGAPTERCDDPGAGWSNEDGDCDDAAATTFPGADELCDAVDNDCNTVLDDGWPLSTWWRDDDGDGYGGAETVAACVSPGVGYVAVGGDCDDGDASVSPIAEERCGDTIDEDCDGVASSCAG